MTTYHIITLVVLLGVGLTDTRADEANDVLNRSGIIFGAETNGFNTGIQPRLSPTIVVYLHKMVLTNIVYKVSPQFLGTTNGFCGPIALIDATGADVPLLKPEVNDPKNYPEQLNWSELEPKMHGIALNLLYQNINVDFNELGLSKRSRFDLREYFQIKNPGEYKLVVSQKIYSRLENPDLYGNIIYQRLDLPPVTIPIKWEGTPQK